MSPDAVSRETAWLASVGAGHESVAKLRAYAALLEGAGVAHGLLGPREGPRVWSRHVMNCAAVVELLPRGALRVVDVGSGAGLPGLVLGCLRPDITMTLIEPLARRATFLEEAIGILGLTSAQVVRARADESGVAGFDVVTSRALAPLDRLARWCLPLCRPGGVVLAVKGASAPEELLRHGRALRDLGVTDAIVKRCGEGAVDPPTTVLSFTRPPMR